MSIKFYIKDRLACLDILQNQSSQNNFDDTLYQSLSKNSKSPCGVMYFPHYQEENQQLYPFNIQNLPQNSNLRVGFDENALGQAGSFIKVNIENLTLSKNTANFKLLNSNLINIDLCINRPKLQNEEYSLQHKIIANLSTENDYEIIDFPKVNQSYDEWHGHKASIKINNIFENGLGIASLTMLNDEEPKAVDFVLSQGVQISKEELKEKYFCHGEEYRLKRGQEIIKNEHMILYVTQTGNICMQRPQAKQTVFFTVGNNKAIGHTINASILGFDGLSAQINFYK